MADVFYQPDAVNLVTNKHIIFFGDSNTRAVYKDLLWLLNENVLIDQRALKRKQEGSFCGDRLGNHSAIGRGREYEEERLYEKNGVKAEFYFITRCYTPRIVDIMEDINLGIKDAPDVVFLSSTLWDVTRWGPNGVKEFKENMVKLARLLKTSLPTTTLVIWGTALPVSNKVQSSLLVKQIGFLQYTLRFDVMEANNYASQVMVNHGFDVLDYHYYMRMQIHRRVEDGVHYYPTAIRFLTNLLLTHIALTWDVPLPGNAKTILLEKAKALCGGQAEEASEEEPELPATPPNLEGDEKEEKEGEEAESNNCYNNRLKPQKSGQPTEPQTSGQPTRAFRRHPPNHPQQRFYQSRRMKGDNWRNRDGRQGEPQFHEMPNPMYNPWVNARMEQPSQWSQTPSHGQPWSYTNVPQTFASTSSAETNWSEDHWPAEQGFGAEPQPQPQPQTSILARSADMLAQAQAESHQIPPYSSYRYHPYYDPYHYPYYDPYHYPY